MVAHSGDADIANRSLKLDERMGLVVSVGWTGLTSGTVVGIMADSTLVSVASDVCLLKSSGGIAQRTITVDAVVASLGLRALVNGGGIKKGFVNGYKTMPGMNEGRISNAGRAEIPIGAIEALVTNTIDVLFFL